MDEMTRVQIVARDHTDLVCPVRKSFLTTTVIFVGCHAEA